jgi:hypothetical protein
MKTYTFKFVHTDKVKNKKIIVKADNVRDAKILILNMIEKVNKKIVKVIRSTDRAMTYKGRDNE